MNKTHKCTDGTINKILVDTDELKLMLSCGRITALKIGEEARARMDIGRRVLWNVQKIRNYLEENENLII